MEELFHSVELTQSLCKGCTNCVRRCPTEAIRVRHAKAYIIKERCIDCGECIRVCPNHAKKAVVSPLSSLEKYAYTIALPAPALYAQFQNLYSPKPVLDALERFGFDMVYEVASAAEIVTLATRKLMEEKKLPLPVISSACPAVLRLIRVRFPQLIPHILPLKAPAQYAALYAKRIAMEKTGLPKEKIGTVFLSPCPAKATAAKNPLASHERYIDEVIAIRDIYPKLLPFMKASSQQEADTVAGKQGVCWGKSGGEARALSRDWYISADGVDNVIRVLEDLEDEKITNIDFIELNMCSGGCVGGILNVENPHVARAKLENIANSRKPSSCILFGGEYPEELNYEKQLEYIPALRLDDDLFVASQKLRELHEIEKRLCGLDCGSCGAPSCHALAEDIVRGFATEDYCVYRMAEMYSKEKGEAANLLPIAFRP